MNENVEVLWLAENGYHVGSKLQEHSHQEYFQVHYVLGGKGKCIIDHQIVELEQGMFSLMPPGILHGISEIQAGEDGMFRVLEAKFTLKEGTLLEEVRRLPVVCHGTAELQTLLYQVFLEGVQKDTYYEDVVTSLFTVWLYRVVRHCKDYDPDVKRGDFRPRPTMRIKRYLYENYQKDISLDHLAAVTGYSKNYLCRIFRENTGMTINQYLNEVRIGKAVDLLAGTDLDLAEVAGRCGYNSVFYFIKAFKKRMGIPPGSYRKSELTGVDKVEGHVDSVNSAIRASDVLMLRINQAES